MLDSESYRSHESHSSSVFNVLAQKTMDRKEKIRLMYSLQNGLTNDSMPKLTGFTNSPQELLKKSVANLHLSPQ